jgi:hypothetical protein
MLPFFNETTPHVELAHELKNRGHHVILVDYQPTSENMVIDFAQRIIARLPADIRLFFKIAKKQIRLCRMVRQLICNSKFIILASCI